MTYFKGFFMSAKYILGIASIFALLILVACGDDSSSSAQGGPKYILDETNQKFAIIYDRCYVTENSTRWDEYVDTSWFHYKFFNDTLVVFRDGNTADGFEYDEENVRKEETDLVMTGGKSDEIIGTWKTTSAYCYYDEDGKIDCNGRVDEDGEKVDIFVLDISKNSIAFSWELNENLCYAEEYVYDIKDILLFELKISGDDLFVSNSDCNNIKIKANGKKVSVTTSIAIGKDNVATEDVVYTSGNKTCRSTFKKVHKLLQQPESLCNVNDMEKYMGKASGYPHKYQVDNDKDLYSCLAEMLGVDYDK